MTGAPSRWSPPGPGGRQVDRRSVEVHAAGRAKEVNIAIAEGAAISSDQPVANGVDRPLEPGSTGPSRAATGGRQASSKCKPVGQSRGARLAPVHAVRSSASMRRASSSLGGDGLPTPHRPGPCSVNLGVLVNQGERHGCQLIPVGRLVALALTAVFDTSRAHVPQVLRYHHRGCRVLASEPSR